MFLTKSAAAETIVEPVDQIGWALHERMERGTGGTPLKTVRLDKSSWNIGDILNAGGFAEIYQAVSDDFEAVAKFIPRVPGASRELLFEELSGLPNIVPVLDSGETDKHYILVMPRAEKSLRDHVNERGGRLEVDEARAILSDVAEALAALEKGVVHRDLKPDNVLLLEGRWCLADFGIARTRRRRPHQIR
jgi:serine/threonine-protein kinase